MQKRNDVNDYKYGTSETQKFLFLSLKNRKGREQEATSIWAASREAENRKYNLKISGKVERMATTHGSNIRKWRVRAIQKREKGRGLYTASE